MAFAVATCLLCVPPLFNGLPLLYSDSLEYMRSGHGIVRRLHWQRVDRVHCAFVAGSVVVWFLPLVCAFYGLTLWRPRPRDRPVAAR